MRSRCLVVALVVACGGGDDAPPDDAPTEHPWAVPLETWTWVDVPGMVCGNGSPTGIALNPSTRSEQVVLFFEGGGACWEAAACYGIVIPVTASHLDGFTAQTFEQEVKPQLDQLWMIQRGDATSLFADASWVFVPYCTGDLHAGTQETTYEALGQMRVMSHRGASNVDAMLDRISSAPADEVFAIGFAAGGFGVQLNWDRIAAAFPAATTHAFADGSQMVPIESGRWGALMARWAPRFPAGCTDCGASFDRTAAFWRTSAPGRLGLVSSLQDGVLRVYFGYDAAGMRAASLAIGTAMTGTAAAFMIDNDTHTRLFQPETMTSTGDVLRPWASAWATGGAAFTTVGP